VKGGDVGFVGKRKRKQAGRKREKWTRIGLGFERGSERDVKSWRGGGKGDYARCIGDMSQRKRDEKGTTYASQTCGRGAYRVGNRGAYFEKQIHTFRRQNLEKE